MRRVTTLAFAVFTVAATAFGASGTFPRMSAERSVIESDPLKITARLPVGWSVEEGRVVPPVALRSDCQVHREMVHDDWNRSLAAVMRDSAPTWRELMKIGGHVAVEYRTTVGSRTTTSVYINLEEIQPATFAVWSVETDNTDAGLQCQHEFSAFVDGVKIDK
ncbi:MAG TPA: hypothetical protein VF219_23275 [Vicinamibacterales bacterium]